MVHCTGRNILPKLWQKNMRFEKDMVLIRNLVFYVLSFVGNLNLKNFSFYSVFCPNFFKSIKSISVLLENIHSWDAPSSRHYSDKDILKTFSKTFWSSNYPGKVSSDLLKVFLRWHRWLIDGLKSLADKYIWYFYLSFSFERNIIFANGFPNGEKHEVFHHGYGFLWKWNYRKRWEKI